MENIRKPQILIQTDGITPYKGQYISISRLLASGVIPKDKMVELCRENGIELVLDTP